MQWSCRQSAVSWVCVGISWALFELCLSGADMTEDCAQKTLHESSVTSHPWKILPDEKQISFFNEDKEKEWDSPWYFVQGADPQYGLIERYINKNPVPNWDMEIKLTEKAVEKINSLHPKPRFFVICGDLLDAVPTEDPDIFKSQEDTFKKIFSKIQPDIPVLVTCGNHDIGDKPSPEALQIYRNTWGDDYYSFWCGGILFVVINTQYYMNSENVTEDLKAHDSWLEERLQLAKSKPGTRVIVLQHIPWFLKSADEPASGYFTVGDEVRDRMLDKFVDAGVEKVFCGHYHRNAGGIYKNMEVIVSSAIGGQLGPDKSGIRLVKVYKDKIEHCYYGLDEIPSTVEL